MGHITDSFGERLDPFSSGEGAFRTGVDVASDYGAPVHATADGIVTIAENHTGYGRRWWCSIMVSALPPGMRTSLRFQRCPERASSEGK